MTESLPCPSCGALAGVPLVPGLPDDEMTAAYGRGEIMFGGCVIYYETHACRACDHRWIDNEDLSVTERPDPEGRHEPRPPTR